MIIDQDANIAGMLSQLKQKVGELLKSVSEPAEGKCKT